MKKTFLILLLLLGFHVTTFSPYASTEPTSTENKATGMEKAPVLLAHSWDGTQDIKGWWMSEKLDGVRGYWTGSEMLSRSGKKFQVPEWFTENLPPFPLDGELWSGRGQFSELSGIVRRKTPDKDWKKVRYLVFDAPKAKGGFEEHLDLARSWFREHPTPYAEVLKQEICQGKVHLLKKLAEIESLGGEGIMLRRPGSLYTVGHTYDLLKVKTFEDTEATVVGHIPGKGKHEGRLGSLLVELPNGIHFAIGTGFSDKERENPPPMGSVVTFKYQGFHKSGIPRFASFLRIREEF